MSEQYVLPRVVLPGVKQRLSERKDPVTDMLAFYGMRKEE
jgi:hypothetical protein